jgi:hypothetical protein
MGYWVAALGIVALFMASVADGETLRQQSRRSVDLSQVATVTVQNSRGQIELRPSPDRTLHLTALKTVRGPRGSVVRRLADETQVELVREGDRYRIRVKYPKGLSVRVNLWEGFNEHTIPRVEVQLVVEVPIGVSVELETASADLASDAVPNPQRLESASGNIVVEAAHGPVTIETASGDVRVIQGRALDVRSVSGDVRIEETRGPLRVGTASGDVIIAGATDSLRIETVSGDVVVDRAPGGAWVRTASGEIELRQVTGRLIAESVSADIRAGIRGSLREARIESSSGDVTLALASNVSCTIEMRTSSGDIRVDVPSQTKTVSRRLVTAVVREGTAPAWLQTVSGNIHVTRGEP